MFILIAETLTLVICVFSHGIWFDGSLCFPLEVSFTNVILGEGEVELQVKGNKVRQFFIEPREISMLSVHNSNSFSQM